MNAEGFKHVATALQKRLETAVNPALTVHVGPLDDQDASSADLVLFLYRLAINPDLRNAGHLAPPKGAVAGVFYEDSIPFDLHFVLSASPSRRGQDIEGLAMLGAAVQALFGTPDLTAAGFPEETMRLSLESVATDELGRIWSLFPTINYRTSILFLATPVWIDPAQQGLVVAPVVGQDMSDIQPIFGPH